MSRNDRCNPKPRDPNVAAKCCRQNSSLSYCDINQYRGQVMQDMRRGPPQGAMGKRMSMGGMHIGRFVTWDDLIKWYWRNPDCFRDCFFRYLWGWIDWYGFLRCLCRCFYWRPWWCWWFGGGPRPMTSTQAMRGPK